MDKKQLEKLSKQFIEAALHLKEGEKIWIEYQGMYAQEIAHSASRIADCSFRFHIRRLLEPAFGSRLLSVRQWYLSDSGRRTCD